VKHSDLLDALATLFDVSTRRTRAASPARPSAVAKRKLHVLVAEDNAVNRKLVLTLLRRRGHQVTAVANGRQAVDAIQSPRSPAFDVVLMDLQMPEMGGFEATQAIRTSEMPGGRRVPIIALTAHAMQGDRERCLQAGMDGYLSKPVDVDELLAAVERFGRPGNRETGGSADREIGRSGDRGSVAFDEKGALSHTGNDPALLRELLAMFRKDRPASVERIERAIKNGDAEEVRMSAHAIKGPLGTLGARRSAAIAAEIEQMGREKELANAPERLTRLRDELQQFDAALAAAGFAPASRASKPSRTAKKPAKRNRR